MSLGLKILTFLHSSVLFMFINICICLLSGSLKSGSARFSSVESDELCQVLHEKVSRDRAAAQVLSSHSAERTLAHQSSNESDSQASGKRHRQTDSQHSHQDESSSPRSVMAGSATRKQARHPVSSSSNYGIIKVNDHPNSESLSLTDGKTNAVTRKRKRETGSRLPTRVGHGRQGGEPGDDVVNILFADADLSRPLLDPNFPEHSDNRYFHKQILSAKRNRHMPTRKVNPNYGDRQFMRAFKSFRHRSGCSNGDKSCVSKYKPRRYRKHAKGYKMSRHRNSRPTSVGSTTTTEVAEERQLVSPPSSRPELQGEEVPVDVPSDMTVEWVSRTGHLINDTRRQVLRNGSLVISEVNNLNTRQFA